MIFRRQCVSYNQGDCLVTARLNATKIKTWSVLWYSDQRMHHIWHWSAKFYRRKEEKSKILTWLYYFLKQILYLLNASYFVGRAECLSCANIVLGVVPSLLTYLILSTTQRNKQMRKLRPRKAQ